MSLNRYERFLKTLSVFGKKQMKGEIIDKSIYQFKLLSSILKYYETELGKIHPKKLKSKYKSVFIFLPSNIPIEFLQFMFLIYSYDLEIFFKLPSRDSGFIKSFFNLLNDNKIKAGYLTHEESIKKGKKYDFIIGSGSTELETVLKNLNRPYRFFGPKFSFAILEDKNEENIDNIIKDFLSFDTEGCLSTRFVFTVEDIGLDTIRDSIKRNKTDFYPQKSFKKEVFDYYNQINLFYSNESFIGECEAVFKIERMPEYFPQRTLFIKKVKNYDDILDFLEDSANSVQSITTAHGRNIDTFIKNSSVSIFLPFGKSQFPPVSWLFERGLNINNFFQ